MNYLSTGLSLIAMTLLGTAQASTITWSSPGNIVNDSDVSTNGALVQAYNFSSSGSGTTVVNTVAFVNLGSTVTAQSVAGDHNIAFAANSQNLSTQSNFIGAESPAAALGANYKSLLSSAVTAVGAATSGVTDGRNGYRFTLEGLTIGHTYELQLWINDSRSNALPTYTGHLDGTREVDYNTANAAGGLGQYVIGSFTADAVTQAFDFRVNGVNVAQLNAYQLRVTAVPEPSKSMLTGLGLSLLFLQRHRVRSRARNV